MEALIVIRLALLPGMVGFGLESFACKVRGLGICLPVITGIGILSFLSYDKRHAQELLTRGIMPEALGLAVGLSILGGLLAGMLLGGAFYYVKNKNHSDNEG